MNPKSEHLLIAANKSISHTAEPSKYALPRISAGGKNPAIDIDAYIASTKLSPYVTFASEKSLYDPSATLTIPTSSFLSIVRLLNWDLRKSSSGALL